jgi:hypothetical protein
MANTFAVGNNAENHQDTLISSINIGSPGGGNSWDFTMLQSDITGTVTSVDPATTPFFSDFPGANFANHTVTTNQGTTLDLYFYLRLNDTLGYIGSGLTNNILPGFVTFVMNDPDLIQAVLSMTYNTNWNENFTQTVINEFNGNPISTITSSVSNNAVVDAYGTMTLPNIPVLDVLRLREETTITTNSISTTFTTFTFISREGAGVAVTAVVPIPPVSGVIEIDGASYNGILATTAVEQISELPQNYNLKQNYPNPFNPSTKINFSIPQLGFITLKVYDVLGNEVATLVNEYKPAGTYNVEFTINNVQLSSGIYFYRLQAGDYVETKKMLLLK